MSDHAFPFIFTEGDVLRAEYQHEMTEIIDRVGTMFRNGLDEATEKLILAHFEARGYVIVKPTDFGGEKEALRAQGREIMRLQATVAMLRGGGSVAPETTS